MSCPLAQLGKTTMQHSAQNKGDTVCLPDRRLRILMCTLMVCLGAECEACVIDGSCGEGQGLRLTTMREREMDMSEN